MSDMMEDEEEKKVRSQVTRQVEEGERRERI